MQQHLEVTIFTRLTLFRKNAANAANGVLDKMYCRTSQPYMFFFCNFLCKVNSCLEKDIDAVVRGNISFLFLSDTAVSF